MCSSCMGLGELTATVDAEMQYPHYRNAMIGNYDGLWETVTSAYEAAQKAAGTAQKQITAATTKAAEAETKRTLWQIAATGLLLASGMLVVYDLAFSPQRKPKSKHRARKNPSTSNARIAQQVRDLAIRRKYADAINQMRKIRVYDLDSRSLVTAIISILDDACYEAVSHRYVVAVLNNFVRWTRGPATMRPAKVLGR